jgi:hypothetical protein
MLGGSSKVAPQQPNKTWDPVEAVHVASAEDTLKAAFDGFASEGVIKTADLPALCSSLGNSVEEADLEGKLVHIADFFVKSCSASTAVVGNIAVDGSITLQAFVSWWNAQFIGEEDAHKELQKRIAAPPAELDGLVQSILPKFRSTPFCARYRTRLSAFLPKPLSLMYTPSPCFIRFATITCVLYFGWVIICVSMQFSHPVFWGVMFGLSLSCAMLLTLVHMPKCYEVLEDGLVLHAVLRCARFDLPYELIAGPESIKLLTPIETVEDAWCVFLVLAPSNTVQISYQAAGGRERKVDFYPSSPEMFVELVRRQLAATR